MKETVLVTGASSGIGLELARCFAADKSDLVLVARSTVALEKLAAELRAAHGVSVHIITADLAQAGAGEKIFQELQGRGTTVDVLVNNAGFGLHGSFAELPLARQLEIISVNVTALVELTGLFLPGMIERRRGGILNVASTAAFQAGPNMAVYYASKAFVLSFTEALAEELPPTSGVTVSAFCPGPTVSNFGTVARGEKVRRLKVSKMPTEAAASFGYRAFRRGKITAIPGLRNRLLVFLVRLTPRWFPRKLVKFYNRTH
jgi:uncharacterized protein